MVSGYSPSFISRPLLHRHPKPQIGLAQQERELVTKEIHTLLEKGAILRAKPTDPGYYSNLFIVPKKDGGSRPVINLKALNSHLSIPPFKMEGTQNLKDILTEADYMVKLDLQDAYLSVPMHKDMCKYLRFCWEGDVFEVLCLPFGLGPAPMVFTKLLKPVVSYLRLQGIRILVYLDDMLLMAQSVNDLEIHVQTTIQLLRCLGFVLNVKKCQTTPSQTMEFLGFLVDSRSMTLSLPETKVLKIRKECRHMRNQSHVTGRQLAHLIGLLTSCLQAILQASLHYRALQRLRNQALVQGGYIIRQEDSYVKGCTAGSSLVDSTAVFTNGQTDSQSTSRHGPRNRCVNKRMGSEPPQGRNFDRGSLVSKGSYPSHQLARTERGISSSTVLRKEPQQHSHPTEDGQPGGSYICEQEMGGTRSRALAT